MQTSTQSDNDTTSASLTYAVFQKLVNSRLSLSFEFQSFGEKYALEVLSIIISNNDLIWKDKIEQVPKTNSLVHRGQQVLWKLELREQPNSFLTSQSNTKMLDRILDISLVKES